MVGWKISSPSFLVGNPCSFLLLRSIIRANRGRNSKLGMGSYVPWANRFELLELELFC